MTSAKPENSLVEGQSVFLVAKAPILDFSALSAKRSPLIESLSSGGQDCRHENVYLHPAFGSPIWYQIFEMAG
jgi:hypothetical protein